MQKREQVVGLAASVVGIVAMGVAGWWIGGISMPKPQTGIPEAAVAPAAVVPEAAPGSAPAPAVADNNLPVTDPMFTPGVHMLILNDQTIQQPGQVTFRTVQGNVVITDTNGSRQISRPLPSGIAGGNTWVATPEAKAVFQQDHPANLGLAPNTTTVFPIAGGNGAARTGLVNVDANGNIVSITFTDSNGGTSQVTGTGTLVINGNTVVMSGRGAGTPKPAVGSGKAVPANQVPPVEPGAGLP